MMTLLEQMRRARADGREQLRMEMLQHLRRALTVVLPHESVIVFGSILRPGRFSEYSDVDIALERDPAMSLYQLISLLSESLGRRVDVLLLPECRFAEKIRCEGERWTPPA